MNVRQFARDVRWWVGYIVLRRILRRPKKCVPPPCPPVQEYDISAVYRCHTTATFTPSRSAVTANASSTLMPGRRSMSHDSDVAAVLAKHVPGLLASFDKIEAILADSPGAWMDGHNHRDDGKLHIGCDGCLDIARAAGVESGPAVPLEDEPEPPMAKDYDVPML